MNKNRGWRAFQIAIFAAALMPLAGCGAILDTIMPAPTPEPTPKPETLPTTVQFSPGDYVTRGDTLPGTYRVIAIPAGNMVTVQQTILTKDSTGKQVLAGLGRTETMRLAGIETVPKGKPGYNETIATIQHWVGGHDDLQIDIDPKYPWDLKNRHMAQVYFTPPEEPKTALSGQTLNLNRMLVRSGYAIVDLNEATSIDLQGWLNDEVYARGHYLVLKPVSKRAKPQQIQQPLGLWGMGIIIGDRPAPAEFAPPGSITPTPTPSAGDAAAAPTAGGAPGAAGTVAAALPGGGAPPPKP